MDNYKTLKFVPHLVPLVLSSEKTSTWRLFDDKNLQKDDQLSLVNKETGEEFARAIITKIEEKKLDDINDTDFTGHEKFESEEKMYEAYRSYYGDKVTPQTIVKIVDFRLSRKRKFTWKKPSIIQEVGFDFHWDVRKVWALDIPATDMSINDLVWHFDIPFWELADTDDYNLTPNAVINKETGTHLHREKIEKVDISFPIDIMKNKGRWLILDGLHRLVKLYEQGAKTVKVRIIPREKIPEITREL